MPHSTYVSPSRADSCAGCGATVQRSHTSAPDIYCRPCRSAGLAPSKISHGTSKRYRYGCRCDVCVEYQRSAAREWRERRAQAGVPVQNGERRVPATCIQCGAAFEARVDNVRAGNGKLCSRACQGVRRRVDPTRPKKKPRKTPAQHFRARAERLAASAARGTTGGDLVWVQGDCAVCGESFTSRGAASRYCSHECRRKNRSRSFGLSWMDRMAIFARDDWNCHLCGVAVDYLADPISDLYPSLDHLTPQSKGGSHDLANLATAHRICNSIRRDRSVEEARLELVHG